MPSFLDTAEGPSVRRPNAQAHWGLWCSGPRAGPVPVPVYRRHRGTFWGRALLRRPPLFGRSCRLATFDSGLAEYRYILIRYH